MKGQANISGIINLYTKVILVDTTCQSRITVKSSAGYNVGDTVLLIQMQGATINTSNTSSFGNVLDYGNAGNYELATVAAISGNEITLTNKLLRRYDTAGRVQLVRVPFYNSNVNVNGALAASPWDGHVGGILIFLSSGNVTLNASIDVSGTGFRGGTSSVNATNVVAGYTDYYCSMSSMRSGQKGESIYLGDLAYEAGRGRGASGGGGGNDHNAGGGGGGNLGDGGKGGNEYDGFGGGANGGLGGLGLAYSNTVNKIFMGGGGGGGQQNNGVGTAGTNGGGIVMIRAASIVGNNQVIRTNGIDNTTTSGIGDDAGGGGGAGGLVLLDVPVYTGALRVEAKGGAGGGVNWASSRLGPGGGGGGGGVWLSVGTLPANIATVLNGGNSGMITNPSNPNYGSAWGSSVGLTGSVLAGLQIPKSTIIIPMPVVDLGMDTSVCTNSIVLQSSITYTAPAYLWSTGATTPSLTASQAGSYWLHVTENGCEAADTVNIALGVPLLVDLGNDTGICDTDEPIVLSSTQPAGTQYLWSNGQNTTSIKAMQAGKYWLKVTLGNCEGSDTIVVRVVPAPMVDIGNDTVVCDGNSVTIGDVIDNAAFLWNTSSTQPFITVEESGTYWRTLDIEGCRVSDTVQVTVAPIPAPNLGADADICEKQELVLNVFEEVGTYQWNTGETTSAITVTDPGEYWVAITSPYGCIGKDTILLKYYPLPTVLLDRDTTVCEETPLVLKPVYAINDDEIRWSTGSTERQISVTTGGAYSLQAVNKCGSVSDTVNIRQIFCDIWLPNAFTPNRDGINDVFRVVGNISRLESFGFTIYNRWGERLFYTADRYAGWNGRYNGDDVQVGTYIYMLEYYLNGEPILQKGNFHLLR